MAQKAIHEVSILATGTITVALYKGGVSYVSVGALENDVPHSLFSNDSSMENEGFLTTRTPKDFSRCLGFMHGD
jgi:hypothetical protein